MRKSVESESLVTNKLSLPPPKEEPKRKLSKMDTLISFLDGKKSDDSIEGFWNSINDMKTFYFGLAVWCIGWNAIAVYLAPSKILQFLPLIVLGVFFIVSGFHCRYVHNYRKFKHVSFLLLFATIYVFGTIMIFRDLLVSLLINFPPFPELSLKKFPERIMNLGNLGLLLVVFLCNCAVFKKIGEQIGIEIDGLHKEVKDLKNKQPISKVSSTEAAAPIRRQFSKPQLLKQSSGTFSGIEQRLDE